MKTQPNVHILLLIGFILLSVLPGRSANLPGEKSIFDLMNYKEVLDVKLEFDLKSLTEDRRKEVEAPALLSFADANKAQQKWDIKVTLRGRFRRIKCAEMPPLRLDFSKKDLTRMGLAQYDDMKLVTLCMDDNREDKNFLLREYLGYKLYNVLTPASYRVQLVRIHYVDQASGDTKKQMGFLIEDTAQLRARIGAEKVEEMNIIDSDRFDERHRKLVSVFQYLIGNADWGIHKSKNVKYVAKDGKVIPVPYDFDFSALVGADYASVQSLYGQNSLEDRVYLGFETKREELIPTINLLEQYREELIRLVRQFKLLSGRERSEIEDYLNSFFENKEEINFTTKHLHFTDAG